jgi:DNA polymerase-1
LSFYILDIETNAIEAPDKLWCIVAKNLDTGVVSTYSFPSGVPGDYPEVVRGFLSSCSSVSCWIGHNVVNYDLPHLFRLIPGFTWDPSRVIDTLVSCRLLNYSVPGGNSLAAWGERLSCPKSEHTDFSVYSNAMLDYCIQDVLVTEKLYALISPYLSSPSYREPLRTEHDISVLCNDLHDNGFYFDMGGAKDLHLGISAKLSGLAATLADSFPPRVRSLGVIHPKVTRHGTLNRSNFRWLDSPVQLAWFGPYPFTRIGYEPFNPGSPKQCVERLWECGWQPYDKTKGHLAVERELDSIRRATRTSGGRGLADRRQPAGRDSGRVKELEDKLEHFRVYGWKVNEANLATLPRDAPEAAHKLVEWLMLDSRRSTLEEWFEAYNPETHRIHGRFNHIGAWTGRMSHNSPNMANIPGHGSAYGDEMRALWQAEPGKYLVGVDADGIQLRVLAHYMNDKDFIAALTKGRKEDGTDAHTLNQRALGDICSSRDVAKTFIYAFLLGAGTGKISQILECSPDEAREAVDRFLSYYPGLRALKDYRIPSDADRGYFIGLDGRAVACDSEHLMLAGYLQNGEAVIMKTANLIWRENLKKEGIPFRQVNFVHDEWQVEVNSLTDATKAGTIMVSAIEEAGVKLKLNCPLAGNSKTGRNWLETH